METLTNVRIRVRPVTLRDHQDGVPGLEFAILWTTRTPGCADQSHCEISHSVLPVEEAAIQYFIQILTDLFPNSAQHESLSAEFLAALLPYREYIPHPLLASD